MSKSTNNHQGLRAFPLIPLWVIVTLGVLFIFTIIYIVVMAIPKTIQFSYAGPSCVRQLTLSPGTAKVAGNPDYAAQINQRVSIGDWEIFGTEVCITPNTAPEAGETNLAISPTGNWFLARQFSVKVPEAPVAQTDGFIGKTVPTSRDLEIELTQPDTIFEYRLSSNKEAAVDAGCEPKEKALFCDITSLDLDHGQKYTLGLSRYFNDEKINTVAEGEVTTLLPLVQTAANLTNDQVIYNKPKEFVFDFDKVLVDAKVTLDRNDSEAKIPLNVTTAINDKQLIVSIPDELDRKASHTLTLAYVEGDDGSTLADPTPINFTTSGGPKVVGVSVGSYSVAQAGSMTITFDQELAEGAKVGELVTVQGFGVSAVRSGNQVVLRYSGAPFCTAFKISVVKGLEGAGGIVQDEDWAFNSRTTCHSSRTIGLSAQGRAINAYFYGAGSKTVLYVGSIHGNEHSSRLLMNAWMNELEANPGAIPAGTRIVVVPSANPDGVAMNSRYNSARVDLNRNYNTGDWQSDVQAVDGSPLPGGGGSAPESEPETQALARFTRELAPQLTMSYHGAAAYAIGNGCGNSPSLAARYAQITRYRNMTGVSGAFSYQITGTYDDWICERLGRASVLIELASNSYTDFPRHKPALWEMARS